MVSHPVNCAVDCIDGCVLGDDCPHREHLAAALRFIAQTSVDDMVELSQDTAPQRMLRQLERQVDAQVNPWEPNG
ncbi:MAG: hypothetical protein IGQ88_03830 [Gloeomargaritaceae cyanobacterium C42_A2020_066]|nr:hypothetical protein [Gloeomargaritaceae cyanobacterium C42_A2020_066]